MSDQSSNHLNIANLVSPEARKNAAVDIAEKNALIGHPPSVFLTKAIVLEVLYNPADLDEERLSNIAIGTETKDSAGHVEKTIQQTEFLANLPRNSIIAQVVGDGTTSLSPRPEYFLPFFPSHMMLPVKPGEHVWVYKEANKVSEFGWWVCRISELRTIEDVNYTHPDRKHDMRNGPVSTREKREQQEGPLDFNNGVVIKKAEGDVAVGETASIHGGEESYTRLIKNSDAGKLTNYEAVPRFSKRPADLALQGSNNTLIVLGTDRTGAPAVVKSGEHGKHVDSLPKSDVAKNAGTIDIVVGRGQEKSKSKPKKAKNPAGEEVDKRKDLPVEGDVDFENDLSRIYLSMNTSADDNFNIQIPKLGKPLSKATPGAAAVIKSDHLRFVARKGIRIIMQPNQDSSPESCASIAIDDEGNVIITPAENGLIKLGGDDADKAIFTTKTGVTTTGGQVTAPPVITTMGGVVGTSGAHGEWATKIVVK